MIKVNFYNKVQADIDEKKVIKAVEMVIKENSDLDKAEVFVALVSEEEMGRLARMFLKEDKEKALAHPVLSFVNSEVSEEFKLPKEIDNQLGDIVISYERALEQYKKHDKLIDEEVTEWAGHGALHLLGIHHD